MTIVNIQEIKDAVTHLNRTRLREDMQAPVDIYDDQSVSAQTRHIPAHMTASECAQIIATEGSHVAFYGPLLETGFDPATHGWIIRYATWN